MRWDSQIVFLLSPAFLFSLISEATKNRRAESCLRGTDIHAWGGNQPFFSYPRVLGHEICGEIVGLGKNIQNLKNGQQVAVIPYVACQQCPACLSGRTNCCEKISVIGVHQDGGFSEYLSVPVTNLLDAQGIDPQAAALIEPYAISAHSKAICSSPIRSSTRKRPP